jgi:hypothetical protein
MKMLVPVLAVCLFTIAGSAPSIGDDCGRDDNARLDYRNGTYNSGTGSGIFNFKYESRVESGAPTARKYIWCIENTNQFFIAEFMWGSASNEKLYFHGIVEPGRMVPRDDTDSSKTNIDARNLKFRRGGAALNSPWNLITPETIFPSRWGGADRPVRIAQAEPIEKLPATLLPEIVDLEQLSRNGKAFSEYVQEQRGINLSTSFVVTIPTNAGVLQAMERGVYEKYAPTDFTRVRVGLQNIIAASAAGPVSTISLQVHPAQQKDRALVGDVVKRLPLKISIAPTNPGVIANYLQLHTTLERPSVGKDLVKGAPGASLQSADVVLSVGMRGSDAKLGEISASVLVPTRRN